LKGNLSYHENNLISHQCYFFRYVS